ncbi:hypothetical protein [Pseudomonas ovata]|uniref:hypothetical protein n=1 Tax=Pseudomonas ovata TaxID=1839709 RepID=UPI001260322B|nr:hypothetical protein [Pseudomonas ovata]
MKGCLKSRFVHLLSLIFLLLLAVILNSNYPKLTEKDTDVMAFVGFWVTVYGLFVAIFEIARLGSVSDDMAKAAAKSYNGLKLQLELQEVNSCLEIINSSVAELRNNRAVPVIFISRIKHIYFAVFTNGKNTPEHDNNILILNSYEHVAAVRKPKGNAQAAYKNAPQVGGQDGSREHPYKTTIDVLKRMHDDLSRYSASKNTYKSEVV